MVKIAEPTRIVEAYTPTNVNLGEVFDAIEAEFRDMSMSITEDMASALTPGELDAKLGAASFFASMSQFALIGPFLLIFLFVTWFGDLLISAFEKIPWKGHDLGMWVRGKFWFLDAWKRSLEHIIANAIEGLWHDFVLAVHSALTFNPLHSSVNVAPAIQAAVEPVHHEVDQLWNWVQHISEYVYGPHTTVSTTNTTNVTVITTGPATIPTPQTNAPPTTAPQTSPLTNQVHELQRLVHTMTNAINALEGKVATLQSEMTQVQGQVHDVTAHVAGVRALSVGVQTIEEQMTTIRQQLSTEISDLTATQTAQGNVMGQLLPLTILLDGGVRGLDNLRKLEDNMCQCPPQMPEVWQVLPGLYEFITNG